MPWTHSIAIRSIVALATTGCVAEVQGSRGVLGPDHSHLELAVPPVDASREVLRLLSHRGYALVDQRAIGSALALQFRGGREPALAGGGKSDIATTAIGSQFDVVIDPAPGDHSVVAISGVPMIDGIVACPADGTYACETTRVGAGLATRVNGMAEAEIVHGVFAELALEGLVVGPPSAAIARVYDPDAKCKVRRARLLAEAGETEDKYVRLALIESARSCR